MLNTVVCLPLWLSSWSPARPHISYITIRYHMCPHSLAAPVEKKSTSQDIHTTAAYSCTWHLERLLALCHFSDWRRAQERLGEICFILWDTWALPVSSIFFQEEPAFIFIIAGMSLDPWRTAIPKPWLLSLVSVKSCKHENQVLDCTKQQCRLVNHHSHKTMAPLPTAAACGFLQP